MAKTTKILIEEKLVSTFPVAEETQAVDAPKPFIVPAPAPTTQTRATVRREALGMVETCGLIAAINAADAMLKSADVRLIGMEQVGSGLVTMLVRGDVSAVAAAVESGQVAAKPFGQVVAVRVIASPEANVEYLLPK